MKKAWLTFSIIAILTILPAAANAQLTCPSGYGLCSAGWCCPSGQTCCNSNPQSSGCTSNGICSTTTTNNPPTTSSQSCPSSAPLHCSAGWCCPYGQNNSTNVCCNSNPESSGCTTNGNCSTTTNTPPPNTTTITDNNQTVCTTTGSGACEDKTCNDGTTITIYIGGSYVCSCPESSTCDACISQAGDTLANCDSSSSSISCSVNPGKRSSRLSGALPVVSLAAFGLAVTLISRLKRRRQTEK